MVYLNRIYTKTGDDGTTGLGDGTRVPKTHPRIVAYGGVDELNSVIGVALASGLPEEIAGWLTHIQNDLFDVGADLCVPEVHEHEHDLDEPDDDEHEVAAAAPPLRVVTEQVEQLEVWIDSITAELQPMNSFILPGGTQSAAHLHYARTVCRRVEVGVLHLAEFEEVNPQVTMYLNRLSDLLFVLARECNDHGEADVLWVPGKNRGSDDLK